MPRSIPGLGLTAGEIAAAFQGSKWAESYSPVLTVDQAAELLQVPKATLYQWSSEKRLRGCSRRLGKHLRFFRDRLLAYVFNNGIKTNE